MASTYGWGPRFIETELTDEHLVLYLDEAIDRRQADADAAWQMAVESARLGTVFASNRKAYQKWTRQVNKNKPKTVATQQNLELQIAALSMTNPEYVVHGART